MIIFLKRCFQHLEHSNVKPRCYQETQESRTPTGISALHPTRNFKIFREVKRLHTILSLTDWTGKWNKQHRFSSKLSFRSRLIVTSAVKLHHDWLTGAEIFTAQLFSQFFFFAQHQSNCFTPFCLLGQFSLQTSHYFFQLFHNFTQSFTSVARELQVAL